MIKGGSETKSILLRGYSGGNSNYNDAKKPQGARWTYVLFIQHAGRNGLQRGTSKREDVLDTMISLKRPGDYDAKQGARFIVNFEKARGIYGDDVRSFEAWLMTDNQGLYKWEIKDAEESLLEKVVDLLKEGYSQNEIADLLKVSKDHISKLKKKIQTLGLLRDEI